MLINRYLLYLELLIEHTIHSSLHLPRQWKMAVSLSALSTSLSSLSFSSHISQRPDTLSFATTLSLSRFPKTPSLVVSATALAEPETEDLKKFVKSRLPGGFAAQTIIGTGRRKSAIARVVLQEGTGKFIINYRDAKVSPPLFLLLSLFLSNSHLLYRFRWFFH